MNSTVHQELPGLSDNLPKARVFLDRSQVREMLLSLREELVDDQMACTTREAHIRSVRRIESLDRIIEVTDE